ncbi:hypothetical protein FOXG_19100 [Fusarium oxysporum f. sp. lycopersici 4287]|uniref:Uncharacterized protein n=1 Tax=Fusarium oxysporum f. sp. lycopersici (strain 4287 / CBS 123668 / FGSC 9935 / NRRL 34936) TaxID=426428 RepID=A0A0J9UW52_FUSO4|nr:hypothetical protein FOXG_19100 [Fusarium oxysporum f. sp. lycopersici 4287]KAJ9422888.1 hypothetical protein QL093DRAFT_2258102 [Fusarium oxysporum]KNB03083.1 hypothetical protein FOXG_19100 [Fusarium oxysporum f. sp. lycopersici 4287]
MPSDIFNWLPPEVHLNIVDNLQSLHNTRSFTLASPTARRYFHANQRTSFLWPYILEIQANFGDEALVPLALILLQVRKVRAQTRGLTSLQIEQRIRPYLDAVARFDKSEPAKEWKTNLGCISAVINMIREFGPITAGSVNGFRNHLSGIARYDIHIFANRGHAINVFLRYDLYCQLACNGEERLFTQREAEREQVNELESYLHKRLKHPQQAHHPWIPDTMMKLIKQRHRDILLSVDDTFGVSRSARRERNQVEDIIRLGGPGPSVLQRLQQCRFVTRQRDDETTYLDYVSLQGFPFLHHLEQLEAEAQKPYVLDIFFKVTTKRLQELAGIRVATRSAARQESIYQTYAFSWG